MSCNGAVGTRRKQEKKNCAIFHQKLSQDSTLKCLSTSTLKCDAADSDFVPSATAILHFSAYYIELNMGANDESTQSINLKSGDISVQKSQRMITSRRENVEKLDIYYFSTSTRQLISPTAQVTIKNRFSSSLILLIFLRLVGIFMSEMNIKIFPSLDLAEQNFFPVF